MSSPQMSLPTPAPTPTAETEQFWAATGEGRLLLARCRSCGHLIWYPRSVCPDCHSFDTEWVEASGRGTVYSFTVSRRGEGSWREAAPYVIAVVELDEGPRLMTNIVDCDVDNLGIGQPVEVAFADTGEDNALVRFRPAQT
jgi:uncharacterized OB-fold protein